ncbi:MAG TPA: hypothetical protein GX513_05470 [Firmicutes bacterium]|nr:hypothetical protein [Bacillota bacterium]
MRYLWSETISPLPFRKVVERYPESAQVVFQESFTKKSWDNEKDFPALMRRYKAAFLKKQQTPSIVPVADALARCRDRVR